MYLNVTIFMSSSKLEVMKRAELKISYTFGFTIEGCCNFLFPKILAKYKKI